MDGFEFDRNEKFEAGMAIRRAVMGDEHVSRSMAAADADPLLRPIQQAAAEFGWGHVWGRPGLDRKTRSFLSLAVLIALSRPHELRGHIRGAVNNGATREEIAEVILHVAVYAGLPVGLDATRIAKSVFDELDAQSSQGLASQARASQEGSKAP